MTCLAALNSFCFFVFASSFACQVQEECVAHGYWQGGNEEHLETPCAKTLASRMLKSRARSYFQKEGNSKKTTEKGFKEMNGSR